MWAPADEGTPTPDGEVIPEGDVPPLDGAPDTPPAADYSFLPEKYRSGEAPDIDGFKAHYDELVSAQAMREEALAGVPEDAAGYEFAVPDDLDFGDLELPEGFSVNLKSDDPAMAPLFEGLGGFLHKNNLPKEASGELMGLLAKYEAAKFSPLYVLSKSELGSLGTSGQSRIANIERALTSRLPAELAGALKGATTTANGVKALEKLLAPRTLSTPTPQPNAEDLDNMSPYDKLKLANSRTA